MIATPGTVGNRPILSIAMHGGHQGGLDIAAVPPFVGLENFASYTSLSLLDPIVRARWERLGATDKSRQSTLDIDIEYSDGRTEAGVAVTRLTLTDMDHVSTDIGSFGNVSVPALNAPTNGTLETLEVRDENNQAITGPMPDPVPIILSWSLFAMNSYSIFGLQATLLDAYSAMLTELHQSVLEPLYQPFQKEHAWLPQPNAQLEGHEGEVLHALDALWMRGNLIT